MFNTCYKNEDLIMFLWPVSLTIEVLLTFLLSISTHLLAPGLMIVLQEHKQDHWNLEALELDNLDLELSTIPEADIGISSIGQTLGK